MCLSQTNFPGTKQILSPSLTALKLTTKHLQPEVLSAYSYAFPELRNVTIEATYKFGNPLSFVVDMPITEFNHMKIHLDIDSSNPREKALDKPVLLEIISQKLGQKKFLANICLSNQVEEIAMATNKEYGYKFAINCASIDLISVSFNEMHVFERYPLSL